MRDIDKAFLEQIEKAANDPNILGIYRSKRRATGDTAESCFFMARALSKGETVSILSIKEDNVYLDQVKAVLKSSYSIDVNVEVVTRKEPQNNMQGVYDKFGELLFTKILDQVDVFAGWKLTIKT